MNVANKSDYHILRRCVSDWKKKKELYLSRLDSQDKNLIGVTQVQKTKFDEVVKPKRPVHKIKNKIK